MKEYDKAWAKYQNGLRIIPLPIISWEYHQLESSEYLLFKSIQRNWKDQTDFLKITKVEKKAIVVTDQSFNIVFATTNIEGINGYKPDEIIGKSPKMFQGEETSLQSKENIRRAIQNHEPFKEVLLNYSKEGNIYYCEIEAYPKFGKDGQFLNYIAFESVA